MKALQHLEVGQMEGCSKKGKQPRERGTPKARGISISKGNVILYQILVEQDED